MTEWARDDQLTAQAEGWDVFMCDDVAHPPFELQRIDFPDDGGEAKFPDDMAAWAHVVKRAAEGSPLHSRALAFLEAASPVEHHHVVNAISYADEPFQAEDA
jgi:hypothetical protein